MLEKPEWVCCDHLKKYAGCQQIHKRQQETLEMLGGSLTRLIAGWVAKCKAEEGSPQTRVEISCCSLREGSLGLATEEE